MNKDNNDNFANPFWDYAVKVYERAAVREHCLALQETNRADVNILLFLCWRAAKGAPPPDTGLLTAMMAAMAPVKDTAIEPLRRLRRTLRAALPGETPGMTPLREVLRQHVLTAEIAAEAVGQMVLYGGFPLSHDSALPPDDAVAAGLAVARYLELIGTASDVATREAAALAAAVFEAA